MVKVLCQELLMNSVHENLGHALFRQSLQEYCPNFVTTCLYQYDYKTVAHFSESFSIILNFILKMPAIFITSDYVSSILIALDCMIPNFSVAETEEEKLRLNEYSVGKHMKRDCLQVSFYQRKCANIKAQRLSNKDLWQRFSSCPNFLQALADLVHVFKMFLLNVEISTASPCKEESLLVDVSMKFKLLLGERFVQEHNKEMLLSDIKQCLRLMEKQMDSDLLSFVCREASTEEIRDLKKTTASKLFFILILS